MKKLCKVCICSLLLLITVQGYTLFDKKPVKALTKDADDKLNSKRRPNIVNIILDDFGWSDSSLYGSEFYETPNMEALAEDGVIFTNAYAGSNLCSPTRAMLLTGRYGPRNGVSRLTSPNELAYQTGINPQALAPFTYSFTGEQYLMEQEQAFLPNEEITIAEQLQQAGYTTDNIGKWHLGDPERGTGPLDQGYDINIGGYHRGQPPTYFSPYNIPYLENGPKGEYLSDRLGEEAANFIAEHKNEPFFLNFSQYAVHTPLQAKKEIVDKYRGKQPSNGQDNATYAGVIESADEAIGRVVQAIKDNGLEEDTIIIVSSDNGGLHYWNVTSNAPLRKGKCFNYEGGIRVPTIISWKGHIESGTVNDTPIHSVDYFPTFSEIAGIDLPSDRKIDGVSLLPMLTEGKPLEERSLYWFNPHFNPDTKLVLNENPDKKYGRGDDEAVPTAAIRQGTYKLIKNFAPATYSDGFPYELYDLSTDIGESHNLAEEMPERVQSMALDLDRWLMDTNARQPVKVSKPDTEKQDFKISQSEMKIKASTASAGHDAALAIDGQDQTFWQSSSLSAGPQSITVELNENYEIDHITYQPPKMAKDGAIIQYEVYTSIDGENYDLQTKGTWNNDNTLKTAKFANVQAKYIKLRAIDGIQELAAAAELNIYKSAVIDHIEPVVVTTLEGLAPVIPASANTVYANGITEKKQVTWNDTSNIDYNTAGIYEISGSIDGIDMNVMGKVHVLVNPLENEALVNKFDYFDGLNDGYKILENTSELMPKDSFSIQFNVNWKGTNGNWQTLIQQYNDDLEGFRLDITPDGYLALHVNKDIMSPMDVSRPWIALQSKQKLQKDTPVQIRFSYSNLYKQAIIYMDNKVVAQGEIKGPIKALGQNMSLGSSESVNGLNAVLSRIRVYSDFMQYTNTLDGDYNKDNVVDLSDLGIVTAMNGQESFEFDMNENGMIDDYEIEYVMNQIVEN